MQQFFLIPFLNNDFKAQDDVFLKNYVVTNNLFVLNQLFTKIMTNDNKYFLRMSDKENRTIWASSSMSILLKCMSVGLSLGLSNPIDFIRFRMQTMPQLLNQGLLLRPYEGTIDCATKIRVEEGLSTFWKGTQSNLLRFYSSEALNWGLKEAFHSALSPRTEGPSRESSFAVNYCCGAMAGLLTKALLYPLEFARNCISSTPHCKNNVYLCLKHTLQRDGWRALYKGAFVSLVGATIFRSTYFGIYDTCKINAQNMFQKWCLSYVSVFFAILFTYPADTVRRRIMIQKTNKVFTHCAHKIYRQQGIKGYFRGGSVILLQSITSASIYFTIDLLIKDLRS